MAVHVVVRSQEAVMWAFQDLANVDVIPFNEFDEPGTRFCDIYQEPPLLDFLPRRAQPHLGTSST